MSGKVLRGGAGVLASLPAAFRCLAARARRVWGCSQLQQACWVMLFMALMLPEPVTWLCCYQWVWGTLYRITWRPGAASELSPAEELPQTFRLAVKVISPSQKEPRNMGYPWASPQDPSPHTAVSPEVVVGAPLQPRSPFSILFCPSPRVPWVPGCGRCLQLLCLSLLHRYIERKAFLERVDHRQFEIERDIRLSRMKP